MSERLHQPDWFVGKKNAVQEEDKAIVLKPINMSTDTVTAKSWRVGICHLPRMGISSSGRSRQGAVPDRNAEGLLRMQAREDRGRGQ